MICVCIRAQHIYAHRNMLARIGREREGQPTVCCGSRSLRPETRKPLTSPALAIPGYRESLPSTKEATRRHTRAHTYRERIDTWRHTRAHTYTQTNLSTPYCTQSRLNYCLEYCPNLFVCLFWIRVNNLHGRRIPALNVFYWYWWTMTRREIPWNYESSPKPSCMQVMISRNFVCLFGWIKPGQ